MNWDQGKFDRGTSEIVGSELTRDNDCFFSDE